MAYKNSKKPKEWKYSNYTKIFKEVVDNFPFDKPRPHQLETISEIFDAINKGYKYIVLEAGTGTGKSAIAATIARIYDDAYILTITKQLQNQYISDFKDYNFALVKGRKNFKCLTYSNDKIDENCDYGKCVLEGYSCDNKVTMFDYNDKSKEQSCPYYYQKAVGLNSEVVISNYDYIFLELHNPGGFQKRELMIFDEAHNLESKLMDLITLEFTRKDLKEEVGINLSKEIILDLEINGYKSWIQFAEKIKNKYQKQLKESKESLGNRNDFFLRKKIENLKLKIRDFSKFIKYIKVDPNNWIVDYNKRSQTLSFKPIKIDKYAKDSFLRYGDICIFMSGTILNYSKFAKWLGIKEDEIYAIRRKSPFDIGRNPIKTYSGLNMTYKYLPKNSKKSIPIIKEILEKHKNDKGIIHTVSYQCKEFLKKELDDKRLIDHKNYNREKVLNKFKKSKKPLVLISPSMNQGVDLPGDQCRFQIIYKIPYPSIKNKQTDIRRKKDPFWFEYQTAITLVQTYGRGMRSEDDYCKTYFIDSRLDHYLKVDNARHYLIPDYFKKAVNIEPTIIKEDKNYLNDEKPKNFSNNESNPKIIETDVIRLNNENSYENKLNISSVKDNIYEYDSSLSFKENISNKMLLKQNVLLLKSKKDYSTLIDYLNLLIKNSYFINDYYPYRQLCMVYELMKDFKGMLDSLKRMLKSDIFLPPYQLIWIYSKLNIIRAEISFNEFDILQCFEYYQNHGAINKSKLHTPVPVADCLVGSRNNLKLVSKEEYEKYQKKYELTEIGRNLEKEGKYEDAIEFFTKVIHNEKYQFYDFYKRICFSLEKLEDYERELDIIKLYYKCPPLDKCKSSDTWFANRLNKINSKLDTSFTIEDFS
ncbi:helicase C-terminal domain-containing protein [Methanobrevibacter sp.]